MMIDEIQWRRNHKGDAEMKKIGSKKTVLKIIWILFALISVLIWIPQVDGLITKDYSEVSKYIDLDDAWDITINDETWHNVLLTDFHFPSVRKGTVITMQRTLPSDWGLVEGAMRFYVRHDAVRMYIDDEQIYEYGQDRLSAGKTVGSGYQYIKFPNEYQGKTLRIHLSIIHISEPTRLGMI